MVRLLREHRLRCALAERERVAAGRAIEFRALEELAVALRCVALKRNPALSVAAPPRGANAVAEREGEAQAEAEAEAEAETGDDAGGDEGELPL